MNALGVDIGGSAIKLALLVDDDDVALWTHTSDRYHRPDVAGVTNILASTFAAVSLRIDGPLVIGVCAPGLYDAASGTITRSVNLPGLIGLPLAHTILSALPPAVRPRASVTFVTSDARAAGHDFARAHNLRGRFLGLSLGTGVGATVLDDGVPLCVSGHSPGHLGQLDVTVPGIDPVPVGPDGGRGGLEAYIGAPALAARHGDVARWLQSLRGNEPELLALARAIRIAHAIYRPQRIALLGGIGARLGGVVYALEQHIRDGLSSLARPGWTLAVADDDFHAARGAAELARSV